MARIVLPDGDGGEREIPVEQFKIRIRDGLDVQVTLPPEGPPVDDGFGLGVFGKDQALVIRPGAANTIEVSVEMMIPCDERDAVADRSS